MVWAIHRFCKGLWLETAQMGTAGLMALVPLRGGEKTHPLACSRAAHHVLSSVFWSHWEGRILRLGFPTQVSSHLVFISLVKYIWTLPSTITEEFTVSICEINETYQAFKLICTCSCVPHDDVSVAWLHPWWWSAVAVLALPGHSVVSAQQQNYLTPPFSEWTLLFHDADCTPPWSMYMWTWAHAQKHMDSLSHLTAGHYHHCHLTALEKPWSKGSRWWQRSTEHWESSTGAGSCAQRFTPNTSDLHNTSG